MEGLIFFWVSWGFWVIATFFMQRSARRLKITVWILMMIIASPYVISIFEFKISLSGVFLFGTLFYLASQIERLKFAYLFICSFIIMLAYVSFQLFELFDPVWLLFPRNWMLAVLIVSLTIILQGNKYFRIIIVMLGSIQGEFLYALILQKYSFPYIIGSFSFLDVTALSVGLLTMWNGIEFLTTFFDNQFNELEREKHKLS